MLKCNECAVELGDFKKLPSPRIRWFWLETPDWKTRMVFCDSCKPNDSTIQKIILRGVLKSSALRINGEAKWGDSINLDEFCLQASGGFCSECKKPLGDKVFRDGWKMYHPKCRGVISRRYKLASV